MSRVIFSIQYEINPDKKAEYLDIARELKNLVKAEGLESYSIFELKGKKNIYGEIHVFENKEAYENFEDSGDERLDILMDKLSSLIVEGSTQYKTYFEVWSKFVIFKTFQIALH